MTIKRNVYVSVERLAELLKAEHELNALHEAGITRWDKYEPALWGYSFPKTDLSWEEGLERYASEAYIFAQHRKGEDI